MPSTAAQLRGPEPKFSRLPCATAAPGGRLPSTCRGPSGCASPKPLTQASHGQRERAPKGQSRMGAPISRPVDHHPTIWKPHRAREDDGENPFHLLQDGQGSLRAPSVRPAAGTDMASPDGALRHAWVGPEPERPALLVSQPSGGWLHAQGLGSESMSRCLTRVPKPQALRPQLCLPTRLSAEPNCRTELRLQERGSR